MQMIVRKTRTPKKVNWADCALQKRYDTRMEIAQLTSHTVMDLTATMTQNITRLVIDAAYFDAAGKKR